MRALTYHFRQAKEEGCGFFKPEKSCIKFLIAARNNIVPVLEIAHETSMLTTTLEQLAQTQMLLVD